jgi:hypothetical protein
MVSINDVNEPPVLLQADAGLSCFENAVVGLEVGTVVAFDPDIEPKFSTCVRPILRVVLFRLCLHAADTSLGLCGLGATHRLSSLRAPPVPQAVLLHH